MPSTDDIDRKLKDIQAALQHKFKEGEIDVVSTI